MMQQRIEKEGDYLPDALALIDPFGTFVLRTQVHDTIRDMILGGMDPMRS